MRGKVGFVLGAALGYVLGTRAGRARYEQIKRGAIAVWETPLVQQGVSTVKTSVGDRVDDVKSAAARAAKSAFVAATQPKGEHFAEGTAVSASARSRGGGETVTVEVSSADAKAADMKTAGAKTADTKKPSGAKSAAKQASPAKKSGAAEEASE